MPSDYAKKRAADKLKSVANTVASKVVGYDLKRPAIFDFYEGEQYGLDWDLLEVVEPFRVVFQATVGAHGRHNNDKQDYAVSDFVQKSKERGLKYGLCHLLLPNNIRTQADFYCRTLDSLGGPGQMMPIVDVEVDWIRGTAWANDTKAWLDIVEKRYGCKPLIYTSKNYWSYLNYYQNKQLFPPPWTRDYPGWFAGYPFIPYLDANVMMPHTYQANGFMDWAIWQYGDKGRSSPPRGYPKFPANDLNLVSPWFSAYLESHYE